MTDEKQGELGTTMVEERKKVGRREESLRVKAELDEWANSTILSSKWKTLFVGALCAFICSASLLWFSASNELLGRIQTFNGALTIPVGALVWAFAFTFIFLVPMKAMQILTCKVMKYSLDVSERMLDVLETADREFEARAERMEARYNTALGKVERLVDQIDTGKHPLVARFERAIRGAREETEDELEKALREGEKEAEDIRGGADGAPQTAP